MVTRNVPCKEHDSEADDVQNQEPHPHMNEADDTQPTRSAAKVGKSILPYVHIYNLLHNITWLHDYI